YNEYGSLATSNAATNLLYSCGICCGGISDPIITLTNIPFDSYDVYVYADAETTDQSTLSITGTSSSGTSTFYYNSSGDNSTWHGNVTDLPLLQTTSADVGSPTINGRYVLFQNMTGTTFTLDAGGSIDGIISNNVYGLQIVGAVPEPSTVVLLSLCGFCWMLRNRRRPLV
ncbi:MAG: PEP-CTERM sorting domain-containing protein, partial [Verrucomicrobiae bacterium]